MTSCMYTTETGIFCYSDKEAGIQFEVYFEDGILCDVFRENTSAFFYSCKKNENNESKILMTIDKETNEMCIGIRKSTTVYLRYTFHLTHTMTNYLFNIGKNKGIAPDFSLKTL